MRVDNGLIEFANVTDVIPGDAVGIVFIAFVTCVLISFFICVDVNPGACVGNAFTAADICVLIESAVNPAGAAGIAFI